MPDAQQGRAKFTGRNTVEVNGKTLQFSAAVIATGATAAVPNVKGLKARLSPGSCKCVRHNHGLETS